MAAAKRPASVDGDTSLLDCPQQMTSLHIPSPLNERLDRMVERARRRGVAASRKSVIWALILNGPVQPEALEEIVREAVAGTALDAADGLSPEEVLVTRPHQPGPRPLG